jgi:hypothetical protein
MADAAGPEHLAAMREKMAAMAAMAEVSAMQASLAAEVKSSMDRIDRLMAEPLSSELPSAPDPEVEAWLRKIESLSAPSSHMPADDEREQPASTRLQGHEGVAVAPSAPARETGASHTPTGNPLARNVEPPTEPASSTDPPRSPLQRWCVCCFGAQPAQYSTMPVAEPAEMDQIAYSM